MTRSEFKLSRGAVVVAGLAGGLAEVLWVGVYSASRGLDGWQVAREVAATVLPGFAGTPLAPAIGLMVHFTLSMALAAGFRSGSGRFLPRATPGTQFAAAVVLLSAVWSVNFLALLPWLNPAFVALLPYDVTFASKLLFAAAMWGALAARPRIPQPAPRYL